MARLLIGWLTIIAIFVSSTPWELVAAQPANDTTTAAVEAPCGAPECPEQDLPCGPCEGGCLCPLCPTLLLVSVSLEIPKLPPPVEIEEVGFPLARGPNPSGVVSLIFHPPRLS